MDSSRFARVKDALVQAMEMDEADRDEYLRELAADDPELAHEVRALLGGGDETPEILDSTAAARWLARSTSVPESPASGSGIDPKRVGRYEILGRLGAGGMGQVFRARQTEPVDREVALKLLRGDTFSPAFRARFDHERQNLALMEHPNIARILDAGEDDKGRPFLVMDLVRGTPITEYCRESRLSLPDRVRLFLGVCRAVQHAHHKGIIHRDIKPSNILVEEIDRRPVPKVIDFGIAKLEAGGNEGSPNPRTHEQDATESLEGRTQGVPPEALSPDSLGRVHDAQNEPTNLSRTRGPRPRSTPPPVTRAGQLLGTLEYMSPEQARGRSTEADARSDVFQLGVTLFEVLTGRHPLFTPETPIDDKWKALRDPVLDAGRIPRASGIDSGHDLFFVISKAMAAIPDDRYPTPNALADELDRWLRHEPVRAHPQSFGYTTRRWVARNPLAAAGLALALVVAVAFGVTVTRMWQIQRQETLRAESALRRAEQAQDFLLQTLSAADPETGDPDLSVRDAVDLAAASLPSGVLTDPELSMRLHWTLGDFHLGLSDWDKAIRHYEQAGDQARQHFGPRSPEAAEGIERMSSAFLAMDHVFPADSLARASLQIRSENFGPNHPAVARSERLVGDALTERGKLEEAESHIQRAIAIFEETGSLEDLRHVQALSDLALIRQKQGRLDEALELVLRSIEIKKRLLGEEHLSIVVHDEHNLGFLQSQMGNHELAAETMSRVLDVQLEHFGRSHSRTAVILENLAREYYRLFEYAAAESLMSESVHLARDLSGDGLFLSFRLANSAFILYGVGNPERALEDIEDCLQLRLQAGLRDHHVTAVAYTIAADVLLALAEDALALEALEQAAAIRERIESPPPAKARVWMREALAAARIGQAEVTRRRAEQARAVFLDQPDVLESRFSTAFLGLASHLEGDFEAARDLYRAALEGSVLGGHRRLEIRTRLVAAELDSRRFGGSSDTNAERAVNELRSHSDSLHYVPEFLRSDIELLSAAANLQLGNLVAAVADLDRARSHVPNAARGHYEARIDHLRGLAAHRRGDARTARELLQRSRAEILRSDVALFGFNWALEEAAKVTSLPAYEDRRRAERAL